MLRNKLHVYGDDTQVPCNLHYGKEMLDRMKEYQDRIALINADTDDAVTFSELAQQTVDIALSLAHIGVKKGDVVTICSERNVQMIPTMLGVFCVGATFSPLDVNYRTELIIHKMKYVKPRIMFCSSNAYDRHKSSFDSFGCVDTYIVYGDKSKDGGVLFKDFLTETANVSDFLPAPVDGWKDIALIVFSGGTTGLTKTIPLTHFNLMANIDSLVPESFKYSSMLTSKQWCHFAGFRYALFCLHRGITLIYSIKNQEADFLKAIDKYKVKILLMSPTQMNNLVKSKISEQYDVTSVNVILLASMPMKAPQVEAGKEIFANFVNVCQYYGMTEAGSVCSEVCAPLGPKSGSVGPPSHGCVLKVVDINTRQPLGPNQRGEICFKSPSLSPEYSSGGKHRRTDAEDFFLTGDFGFYDDDRYFYIVDRIQDLIKLDDVLISPSEINSFLLQHPRVYNSCVVSLKRGGSDEDPPLVVAFIVLQPGDRVKEMEMEAFVNGKISGQYEVELDVKVKFLDKLPELPVDKPDKLALKRML